MNSSLISPNAVQSYPPQEQNFSEFSKYAIVIWTGVLLLIVILTYCSYVCIRTCLFSVYRSDSISTITSTTTEDDPVFPRERGIDESTLRSYPKLLFLNARLDHHTTTVSGCSICLADYLDSDIIRILPECSHIFHLNCIDPWLKMHLTCPICRTPPGTTPLATPVAEVVPQAELRA